MQADAIWSTPGYNTRVKASIFVVEDDPDISFLVRHHLDAAGFAVKIFSSGGSVVEESENQRPTLFILDIMVPGRDGLELCRQIRQTPALSSTPVIFLRQRAAKPIESGNSNLERMTTLPSRSIPQTCSSG